MYADDDDKHALTGTANYSDDDLNWLFPKYCSSIKTFICPSTKNTLLDIRSVVPSPGPSPIVTGVPDYGVRLHDITRIVASLQDNAPGKKAASPAGHSYEVSGFLCGNNGGATSSTLNVRKTQESVQTHVYSTGQPSFPQWDVSTPAAGPAKANPSLVWLIYDADDQGIGDPSRPNEDYPDAGDNHGKEGGNVIFADGHASFVLRANYIQSFILGNDEKHNSVVP